jgi:hypothetical protein
MSKLFAAKLPHPCRRSAGVGYLLTQNEMASSRLMPA